METYQNITATPWYIPRYLLRVEPGATFTVPDDDGDSLANQPWCIETSGGVNATLNSGGTFTVTGANVTTGTGGTFTITHPYVTLPGDGTYRI